MTAVRLPFDSIEALIGALPMNVRSRTERSLKGLGRGTQRIIESLGMRPPTPGRPAASVAESDQPLPRYLVNLREQLDVIADLAPKLRAAGVLSFPFGNGHVTLSALAPHERGKS